MAQSLPANHIEAQIGDVRGGSQVAVGSYIVQIGRVEGGVVNILNGPPATPRSRPQPVRLLPRAFPGMLDRQTETSNVIQALQSQESVECSGEPGSGKTSLLRHLAHQPQVSSFSAGVIYFQVNQQSNADLLKSLFDAFYEYDSPVKPTETEIRHYLQGLNALILLDDVAITPEQIQFLMNIAPNCTFITATAKRSLFGETREVTLKGLPTGEAVSLFQREFGRALSAEEQRGAQYLCEAVDCIPQRVLRAAHRAREENRSLVEMVPEAKSPALDQTLAAAEVKPRSEDEKKVLAALAVFYGAPVTAEHVAAVSGVSGVMKMLDNFESRGLVQSHENRYTLASDVNNALLGNLKPWLTRALAHFVDWTELHRSEPEEIAESAQPILLILQWAVAAEHWPEAKRLGHATEEALALSGKWDMWATALQSILKAAQGLQDRANEAWALHQLGTRALCLGARSAALASLNGALTLRESLNDQSGAAVTRHNLNILLNPPPPDSKPDKSSGGGAGTGPIPLLLKLGVGLLALALIGAFVAWWLWPPALARVVSFTVDPATVPAKGQAQLCYEVENASSVRIEPNIGERKPATKECLPVSADQTTTYTLTALGSDGKPISREVTLNVSKPAPQIINFTSQPNSLKDAGSVRLCYEVANAKALQIDNGVGLVQPVNNGCIDTKVDETTTFTLTATGLDGGVAKSQAKVEVAHAPIEVEFTAEPQAITPPNSASLCYRVSQESSISIDQGVEQLPVPVPGQKDCVKVQPKETTTYTLTVFGVFNRTENRQVTVTVNDVPQVRITRFETNPTRGHGTQLCYAVENARSARIEPEFGELTKLPADCPRIRSLEPRTYTLIATGQDGKTDRRSVPYPPPITIRITSFTPAEQTIHPAARAQARICYKTLGEGTAQISPQPGSVPPSIQEIERCVQVRPRQSTVYTLTVTDTQGLQDRRSVTVKVQRPGIVIQ